MTTDFPSWPPQHADEVAGNQARQQLASAEPCSQRTKTPSFAVIKRASGSQLWTVDGRMLWDFTSGVLVTNLGHSPPSWTRRIQELWGWTSDDSIPLNIYNAVTPVELEANRLLKSLLPPYLDHVIWGASGSEAIHKALWTALRRDPRRDVILATRHGFHGKKGLANAVTGCETDPERDPRVRFISFPREEVLDVESRKRPFDAMLFQRELESTWAKFGPHITALITEPYLGGAGSYHPPTEYLQLLNRFCHEHNILFILDEVQSNFGRTGSMFAFEKHGLTPDMVVLGKSLGNGVPVAAVVGRSDVFAPLPFGELSDTWSANPLSCAAVVATLEAIADLNILNHVNAISPIVESGLVELKYLPMIAHIRGELGGMVWGIETCDYDSISANEWASRLVLAAYQGNGAEGVHLLGPLAGKVIRIAPPLTITLEESTAALRLLRDAFSKLI